MEELVNQLITAAQRIAAHPGFQALDNEDKLEFYYNFVDVCLWTGYQLDTSISAELDALVEAA